MGGSAWRVIDVIMKVCARFVSTIKAYTHICYEVTKLANRALEGKKSKVRA